ncbi:MAG: alpha/beta fold hydrolase [Aurantibacter sp.]
MKKILNSMLPKVYGAYFNALALISAKKAAKKSFQLFCTPRKGRVLPKQEDFLNRAKDGIIKAEGISYQTYRWPGKKDTVLLIHGWESNSFRWRNLISFLRDEDFDVIALDAPAHGYSTSQIFNVPIHVKGVHKIVEKYNPKHVVAHSIGGMTALYHQHKYPDLGVEKIVALGSPSEFSIIVKSYRDFLGLNQKVMTAMKAYFYNLFGFHVHEFSTAKFSEKISIKGLLIHDELDRITPIAGSEKVHASWKNSTLVKTKGFGHSLHQDAVSEKVIDFLKS